MHGGPDEVDMIGHMCWEMVSVMTSNALAAVFSMTIHVVLRREDSLGFRHGDIQVQCATIRTQPDPARINPSVVNQPRMYDVHGLVGGTEGLCDLRWGPMLPIVRRMRIRNIE